MLSWLLPYLAKGHRPDFNNGPGGCSNNGLILAPSVYSSLTRIMAAFCPPGVYSSLTRIMAPPPQAILSLCQMEAQLFKSLTYAFLAVAILAKGHRPDFKNGPGGYSNNDRILVPRRLFESDSNNGPSPGHFNTELQT